ncbi:type II toxin-antitoxin system HicB family antitoxin [Denitrobaculum tricleocarpae]|uniref:Type II toxin-antitoxin system HicB family antitoxin n=1 Tax=Denitrobaculum tricleocarpae TaxID=2591009 RepID=A0A545TT04_9PROT|nr:type II toxin-antitoxin system HicB family antitoxin [Denitrobaculum tricleocarpae]TQV80348.1 type II toxin-antitoxin system HicB family antitoxin [Denitrobaculum tricleocarpae]
MSDHHEYLIVVAPLSEEDGGGFLAHVPDLPGCMGDGDTPQAAVQDASNAIIEWIDGYTEMGREIPAPGTAEQEARSRRDAEINLLADLRDRLREVEKDFESLDSRVEVIERTVQYLSEVVDNAEEQERFEVITKMTRAQQRELFSQ